METLSPGQWGFLTGRAPQAFVRRASLNGSCGGTPSGQGLASSWGTEHKADCWAEPGTLDGGGGVKGHPGVVCLRERMAIKIWVAARARLEVGLGQGLGQD